MKNVEVSLPNLFFILQLGVHSFFRNEHEILLIHKDRSLHIRAVHNSNTHMLRMRHTVS
jgi:hypothetical protein